VTRQLSLREACDAVLTWPWLHDLAAAVPAQRVGRPRQHPVALHLAWAALARLHGSQNRLDVETRHPDAWRRIVTTYNRAARVHPDGVTVDPWCQRLTAHTHRHARDLLCGGAVLDALTSAFTTCAVAQAQQLGLLTLRGGSLTRPSPLRIVYGDGTVVRPIYKNREANGRRRDPDAAEHVRHDGAVVGTNIVFVAARGPEHHHRVVLAAGRVPGPGAEAATALELLSRVIAAAGGGVQAVVYDGAFRGAHHHQLMHHHGVYVINKVHPAARTDTGRTYRTVPLGTWTHTTPRGRDCHHHLAAHHGDLHDTVTTDDGTLTLGPALHRPQLRRHRRADGTWRFNIAAVVPCRHGDFIAWVNPHPDAGDRNAGRTDQLRLLPESSPRFPGIYGLRNDSEAINAEFKRTFVADRAPALGWRRQLLAALAWAITNNARAHHLHHATHSRRSVA